MKASSNRQSEYYPSDSTSPFLQQSRSNSMKLIFKLPAPLASPNKSPLTVRRESLSREIHDQLIRKVLSPKQLSHHEWTSLHRTMEPEIELKRQVTQQRKRKTCSHHAMQQLRQNQVKETVAAKASRWVYKRPVKYPPPKALDSRPSIHFMDQQRGQLDTIYQSNVSQIFNAIATTDRYPQVRSSEPQLVLPKSTRHQRQSTRYGLTRASQGITREEKIKFSEFYRDGIDRVMAFREAGDNYDSLERDLCIDEIRYLQATKFNEIHPILKKLLQQQRVKEMLQEKRYYTPAELEQIEHQNRVNQMMEKDLVVEYRRKAGVAEICGDAVKDRGQIQTFIEKVVRIQNHLLKEHSPSIKSSPVTQRSRLTSQKRKKTSSGESYEYLAMRFFLKTSSLTKHRLRTRMYRVAKLNLPLREVMNEQVFTIVPYERAGSRQFFDLVKLEDRAALLYLIIRCPWRVYDFDHNHQTALHITAKRGNHQLTELMLENNSDPNATDFVGRTPLYYAMKNGFQSIALRLLAHGADPWSDPKNIYRRLPMYHDSSIRIMFRKARQVDLMVAMAPAALKKALRKELLKALAF